MTVEASDHISFAMLGRDEHLYRGAGWDCRIDVTGGVMTGSATVDANSVFNQDFSKTANHMAVGTGLIGGLAPIGGRIKLDPMIQGAAGHPAIMAIEIGGVAHDAFAAAGHGREEELAVDRRVVAGGATLGGMDFTGSNVWRGGGGVTTDTVGGQRGGRYVFLNLYGMVMFMAVEVAGVALSAGAAGAAIDRGVAVAVSANDPGAVDTGVAGETFVLMDNVDRVTDVAGDTEGGVGNLRRVVMPVPWRGWVVIGIGIGEVVGPVATDTLGIRGDGDNPWPVDRILQGRRRGVAVTALTVMHRHRVVGRVTADTEGGVQNMAQAGGGVIDMEMGSRRLFVQMTVEAIHFALVGIGDNIRYLGAGWRLWIDVTAGVVTLDATASLMDGEDLREIANKMAIGTGLVVGLPAIGGRVEQNGMID